MDERLRHRREDVQTVACPRCGAIAGARCIGRRGDRQANHRERVLAAVMALGCVDQRHQFGPWQSDGAPRLRRCRICGTPEVDWAPTKADPW